MQSALDRLGEREAAANVALRASIKEGNSPLVAGGIYALEQSAYVSALCRELRDMLPARASEIGASVRGSIQ